MTRIKAYCIFITLAVALLGAQAGNVEDALSQFNAKPTVTTATAFFLTSVMLHPKSILGQIVVEKWHD